MSVSFARAVRDKLRARGVLVHELGGFESRGNGQTSNYQGGIMHHTATAYGMAPSILWNGRSDLSGPLCNSAGNSDGSITIVAAHPANHAGASGGRSMGPLPVSSSFNKLVWGHEIVYPGNQPMTAAQYNSMIILGIVLTELLGRPNSEWIRSHYETSITGKWDIGYAPGKPVDMSAVRRDINNRKVGGDIDMTPEQWAILQEVHQVLVSGSYENFHKGANAKLNKDLAYVLGTVNANVDQVENQVKAVTAQVNALTAKVDKLSVADVDEAAIAASVVTAIKASLGKDLDSAQLQAAVEAALVKVNQERWAN